MLVVGVAFRCNMPRSIGSLQSSEPCSSRRQRNVLPHEISDVLSIAGRLLLEAVERRPHNAPSLYTVHMVSTKLFVLL